MGENRIEHVGLTVSDLDRAVDWYRTNFGFEETRRFDKPELEIKGATIQLGNDCLELLQPYTSVSETKRRGSLATLLKRSGVNHIALSVDDIAHIYGRLQASRVEFVTELLDARYFFCKDPSGALIEVRQRK